MYFVQVLPTHEDWERMEHGINRVNRRSAEHLHQSVDEVRSAVESNMATWYAVRDDRSFIADLIVKTLQEDNSRTLYVWLTFGSRIAKWQDLADDALDVIAKQNRCSLVRMQTTRGGWERLCPGKADRWIHKHVYERKV